MHNLWTCQFQVWSSLPSLKDYLANITEVITVDVHFRVRTKASVICVWWQSEIYVKCEMHNGCDFRKEERTLVHSGLERGSGENSIHSQTTDKARGPGRTPPIDLSYLL
jgi:hypothetical protein